MTLKHLDIDNSWALFLDRDGVINKKLPGDYVKKWDEFEFLKGVPAAIGILSEIFGKLFIVTNQQGIGKGLMTERDLDSLHEEMMNQIRYAGGNINKIYYSPYRDGEKSVFRKPNIGMARKAKIDFPVIDFKRSIMVGDSQSDMQFGKNAGMITIFIAADKQIPEGDENFIDFVFADLNSVSKELVGLK